MVLNSTVIEKHPLTDELFFLNILPDSGVPDFIPGQYVAIGLPDREEKIIKRAYSIGSSPNDKRFLQFYIARVGEGELTPKLASLKEGDRLYVAPKITGNFTLKHLKSDAPITFIATGTGIAPFISMLRSLREENLHRKITLIHGVRHLGDLAYREELIEYNSFNPTFRYLAAISREDVSKCDIFKGLYRGRVPTLFHEGIVGLSLAAEDQVMLCGNPSMIDEMEEYLCGKGFSVYSKRNPLGNIHFERYWS
jgi:ferredoxin--NADP+ reductase